MKNVCLCDEVYLEEIINMISFHKQNFRSTYSKQIQ